MKKTVLVASTLLVILLGLGFGFSHRSTPLSEQTVDRTEEEKEPRETFSSELHGIHDAEVLQEQEFLLAMIPHHEEAVATAAVVAKRTENEAVRQLAESIVRTQGKEIADMKTWYQTWYGTPYQADGSYTPMMRDLTPLSGKDLERTFLEDMIEHHLGALVMAQQVSSKIQHREIAALAQTIAASQSEEVVAMRIALKQY